LNVSSANTPDHSPALTLVLPFFNEEASARETISALIAELGQSERTFELVLVDNGSRDATGAILKSFADQHPWVRVATVEVNQGYGWGVICGLQQTTSPYVGFMCGDGQIAPADVVRVYRRLVREDLDLCKVVRVARHDGWKRKTMSRIYNFLFSVLFPTSSRDINGTPKLMRRRCYEELGLRSKDWFIDAEIMIKAAEMKYRIGEVDAEFRPRAGGESKVRLTTAIEFLWNMIRYRVRGQ
jgi:glycosyltransferase involved in cell wall biosynthesis